MRGRLNLFQRMMLRWRSLHPYSAIHVLRLAVPLDEQALRSAIAAQLEGWGLTGLVLDAGQRCFEYRGGKAAPVLVILDGGADVAATLDREIERQLNMPFPAGQGLDPFRFFAIRTDDGFHLGVAYDHFIAGGDAVASLLAAIASRYHSPKAASADTPMLYPPTYRSLFARHPMLFLRALAQLPEMLGSTKLAVRPRYRDPDDTYNAFAHVRLSPPELGALRAAATAWNVTLNDLLIAVLLLCLSPFAAERRSATRRREIAVASIVNIRREFDPAVQRAFGQFLAALRVSHPVPDDISVDALARAVHAETARVKQHRLYLRTVFALALAGLYWPLLTLRQRRKVFAKHYPTWGGVTMLNVDALWPRDGAPTPHDYLRGVSTGPMTPVVMAISTAAGALSVGVSYRRSAFSPEVVAAISDQLRRCAQPAAQ